MSADREKKSNPKALFIFGKTICIYSSDYKVAELRFDIDQDS